MLNKKLRFGKRVWVMVFYHRPEGAAEWLKITWLPPEALNAANLQPVVVRAI
jgi:hypothetical protein